VLRGKPGKMKFLVDLIKYLERPTPAQFNNWIEMPTAKDRFTPLHFASYRANVEAICMLLELGADKNALTATGLNMLHLAAQGDAAVSLYIFKELGL
jgi:hypothetical protein